MYKYTESHLHTQIIESFMVPIMAWLTVMEYLSYKLFVLRITASDYHFGILQLFLD